MVDTWGIFPDTARNIQIGVGWIILSSIGWSAENDSHFALIKNEIFEILVRLPLIEGADFRLSGLGFIFEKFFLLDY